MNQVTSQSFSFKFTANKNPSSAGVNLTSYTFTIGEGQNSEHTIPSGIFIDPDGDSIYYNYAFFNDFTSLASWVTMVPGYQGTSKFVFTSIPQTTKTGFQVFLSDGIGSASNYFLLNFTLNHRPIASTPTIVLDIYPNLNLTVDLNIDMSQYFSDPENDTLYYSFWDVPAELNVAHTSGTLYRVFGEFDISVTNMNFTFKANDGISLATNVTIQVVVQPCNSL